MVICSTWDLGSGTLPTRMSRTVSMRRLVSESSMGGKSGKQLGLEAGEGWERAGRREIEAGGERGLVDDGIVGAIHVAAEPFLGPADGLGRSRGRGIRSQISAAEGLRSGE